MIEELTLLRQILNLSQNHSRFSKDTPLNFTNDNKDKTKKKPKNPNIKNKTPIFTVYFPIFFCEVVSHFKRPPYQVGITHTEHSVFYAESLLILGYNNPMRQFVQEYMDSIRSKWGSRIKCIPQVCLHSMRTGRCHFCHGLVSRL